MDVGYATNPEHGDPNLLGFELGAQVGISLNHFYGGLCSVYSFGGTGFFQRTICPTPCNSLDSKSAHSARYGLVGGYDIAVFRPLILRPQLGLGALTVWFHRVTVGLSDNSVATNMYLEPGLDGTWAIGHLLLGADVNALWLSDNHLVVAFATHGHVGVAF